jgi:hypothetical protein
MTTLPPETPPPTPTPPNPAADPAAELAQLRADIAGQEAANAAAKPPAVSFTDWPTKGYTGTQPWDLEKLGIEHKLGPGERNNVSPVLPREGLAMLSSGSQGQMVRDLAVRLADLGYPSSITRGVDNPFNVVDDSLLQAVEAFRRDYGVSEDPSAFVRDAANNVLSHIGPWSQEAILRASDRERETR